MERSADITDLIKERFYDTFDALPDLEEPKFNMKMPPSVKGNKQSGMNWIPGRIKELQKIMNKITPSHPDLDRSREIELKAIIDTSITVFSSAFAAFREGARATNKRRRVEAAQQAART